ncbi:MAG TPA: hypothetical protein VE130_01860 [Nitrososphaeraceae archaeon]|jgi:hypothetical protein|nr:hypothetical protein [Nitrososphaeraceae archaeon]
MSYNEPIKEDIYDFSYDNLEFWADEPKEVFEINLDLEIPLKPEASKVIIIGGKITLSVLGYFFTEYMIEGTSGFDNTTMNSYIGRGQVQIGPNYWYQVPAMYQTWNDGYSYGIGIGKPVETFLDDVLSR